VELLNDKSKERCYFVQGKTNATTLASCEAGLQTGLVRGPKTNKVVTHCPVTTRAEIWRTARLNRCGTSSISPLLQHRTHKNTPTHTHTHTCTSLILSSRLVKKPHPTLLQPPRSPDQLHAPHQTHREEEGGKKETKMRKTRRRGGRNRKSIQEK